MEHFPLFLREVQIALTVLPDSSMIFRSQRFAHRKDADINVSLLSPCRFTSNSQSKFPGPPIHSRHRGNCSLHRCGVNLSGSCCAVCDMPNRWGLHRFDGAAGQIVSIKATSCYFLVSCGDDFVCSAERAPLYH